jgi:putative spermidine/putrescine transport system permease protein
MKSAAEVDSTRPVAGGMGRRASAALHRHPAVRLLMLLVPPLGWMVVVYLGTLTLLFLSAFWRLDPFTSLVQRQWGLQNFRTLLHDSVYRVIAVRTVGIAAAVTIADIALAFPLAYYAAWVARRREKAVLLVAVVLPLWSSYLVRVFAWKVILQGDGFLNWLAHRIGLGSLQLGSSNWGIWLVFTYLWLPFVALPIYAALERVPSSYLEASSDLGARGWMTFRRVVWPLALPGVVAGSIFSFSLTLGDYITPSLIGKTSFIGNVVYESVGVASNVPFAAAYALVPVGIMAVFLLVARRLRAFEAL